MERECSLNAFGKVDSRTNFLKRNTDILTSTDIQPYLTRLYLSWHPASNPGKATVPPPCFPSLLSTSSSFQTLKPWSQFFTYLACLSSLPRLIAQSPLSSLRSIRPPLPSHQPSTLAKKGRLIIIHACASHQTQRNRPLKTEHDRHSARVVVLRNSICGRKLLLLSILSAPCHYPHKVNCVTELQSWPTARCARSISDHLFDYNQKKDCSYFNKDV